MSATLTDKLDALDASADFSDPTTYSKLLGYDEAPAAEAAPAAQEQPKGETETPAAAAPAVTPAVTESSATPAAAEPTEQEPAGVLTKDGKHVIPMTVLTDTRNALQRANDRIKEMAAAQERMQQELQARQAGAADTATAEVPTVTAEELESMRADFPEQAELFAKLVKANEALQTQLQAVASATRQPAASAAAEQEVNLQELIDQRPLLSQWQAKGGLAWRAAVEADAQLKDDPEWGIKPYAERFAEVERRIAAELGIPIVKTQAPAAAPATPPAPAKPAAASVTPTTVAPTLTDFSGTPATVGDPMAGMPVGKMVDQAMNMDMEALRRMAGLSY